MSVALPLSLIGENERFIRVCPQHGARLVEHMDWGVSSGRRMRCPRGHTVARWDVLDTRTGRSMRCGDIVDLDQDS